MADDDKQARALPCHPKKQRYRDQMAKLLKEKRYSEQAEF